MLFFPISWSDDDGVTRIQLFNDESFKFLGGGLIVERDPFHIGFDSGGLRASPELRFQIGMDCYSHRFASLFADHYPNANGG